MNDQFVCLVCLSTARVVSFGGWCGCGTWQAGDGDWFGTLLGPEESGPRCTRICGGPLSGGRRGVGGVGFCSSVPPLPCPLVVAGGWGVGGRVLCDLNSGREHLAAMPLVAGVAV
jgi:hypothetical protein